MSSFYDRYVHETAVVYSRVCVDVVKSATCSSSRTKFSILVAGQFTLRSAIGEARTQAAEQEACIKSGWWLLIISHKMLNNKTIKLPSWRFVSDHIILLSFFFPAVSNLTLVGRGAPRLLLLGLMAVQLLGQLNKPLKRRLTPAMRCSAAARRKLGEQSQLFCLEIIDN